MKQTVKRKWVSALRSGEYKQTKGKIRNGNQYGMTYCCLGVLSDLAVKAGVCTQKEAFCGNEHVLAVKVMNWAGLELPNPEIPHIDHARISYLNDTLGYSFDKIADEIQRNL